MKLPDSINVQAAHAIRMLAWSRYARNAEMYAALLKAAELVEADGAQAVESAAGVEP